MQSITTEDEKYDIMRKKSAMKHTLLSRNRWQIQVFVNLERIF